MPMFDYVCGKCGTAFEELVMSSSIEDFEIPCPDCGANESKKQLSAPSVSVGSSFEPACAKPSCSTPLDSGFG